MFKVMEKYRNSPAYKYINSPQLEEDLKEAAKKMRYEQAKAIFLLEYCSQNCGTQYRRHCDNCEINLAIEALEKQMPKKPRETRCALMCANCGHKITEIGCKKLNRFYCKKCGQAIDWSDEE